MGQELLERHVIVMPGPAGSDCFFIQFEPGLRKGGWLQGNTRSFFLLTGGRCLVSWEIPVITAIAGADLMVFERPGGFSAGQQLS